MLHDFEVCPLLVQKEAVIETFYQGLNLSPRKKKNMLEQEGLSLEQFINSFTILTVFLNPNLIKNTHEEDLGITHKMIAILEVMNGCKKKIKIF